MFKGTRALLWQCVWDGQATDCASVGGLWPETPKVAPSKLKNRNLAIYFHPNCVFSACIKGTLKKKTAPRRRKTNIRFLPRPPCFSLDATFPQVGGGDRHSPPTPRRRPAHSPRPGCRSSRWSRWRLGSPGSRCPGSLGGERGAARLRGSGERRLSGGLRGWGGGSGRGPSRQPTK